jgi:hypothetical protein
MGGVEIWKLVHQAVALLANQLCHKLWHQIDRKNATACDNFAVACCENANASKHRSQSIMIPFQKSQDWPSLAVVHIVAVVLA